MSEKPWVTKQVMDKIREHLSDYDASTPEHVEAAAEVDRWLRETDHPDAERIRSTDLRAWAKKQVESATEQEDRRT